MARGLFPSHSDYLSARVDPMAITPSLRPAVSLFPAEVKVRSFPDEVVGVFQLRSFRFFLAGPNSETLFAHARAPSAPVSRLTNHSYGMSTLLGRQDSASPLLAEEDP